MKDYLIDTNYILRFFLKDLPSQYEKAEKIFREIEEKEAVGRTSLLVVNELIWILENYYELERKEFVSQILKLVSLKKIKIIEVKKEELITVLKEMQNSNLDFTDLYLKHFAQKENCQLASFDKQLLRQFGKK